MDIAKMRAYVHARVDVSPSGCWNWRLNLDKDGYGRAHMRGEHFNLRAHRFSYLAFIGAIPAGLVVMHSCDNPQCVNPAHLSAGTQLENIEDSMNKGRGGARWFAGSQNPKCILNDGDVRTIRRRVAGGESHRFVAQAMNCSKTLVTLIATGKRWAHVA